jgi:glutaredoxin 3
VPKIEVYSSLFCPYCARAKNLLKKKGAEFLEIDVDQNPEERFEMEKRAKGRTSVPQIFFDGELIGGSDELVALEMSGKLNDLLTSKGK